MFGMGPQEMLVVGVVVVVFFMLSGRSPSEAGKKLGKSIRGIKENVQQVKDEVDVVKSAGKDEDAQSLNPLDEIKKGLDDIPELDSIKEIAQTTSQLKRFTRFLGR